LAFIPKELIITKDTIEASEVAKHFVDESLAEVAALWLLEQLRSPTSFWKPYIGMFSHCLLQFQPVLPDSNDATGSGRQLPSSSLFTNRFLTFDPS